MSTPLTPCPFKEKLLGIIRKVRIGLSEVPLQKRRRTVVVFYSEGIVCECLRRCKNEVS